MKKTMVCLAVLAALFTAGSALAVDYTYYLPYFRADADFWSALGLRNANDAKSANISVSVYDANGVLLTAINKGLGPRAQEAFLVAEGMSKEGWMRVDSNQPLTGVSFLGTKGFGNYMADMPFVSELSEVLQIPHVAQNNEWDSTVMICNPNSSDIVVTMTIVDKGGNVLSSKNYVISPRGSGIYNLTSFVQDIASGSVEISATQKVAAFALYNNLKWGGNCYSGISALIPRDAESPSVTAVYPMWLDNNTNGINDYVEFETHFSGSGNNSRSQRIVDESGSHHGGGYALETGAGFYNHGFTDLNGDSICDYAQNGTGTWHGPGFVDTDNDEICDYWDADAPLYSRNEGIWFEDQDGNMINDFFEAQWHQGNGHGFTDLDGDGICDYAQDGSKTWHGPGFTDYDKNGIADHWQTGGRGHGGSHHLFD
ncbi:MAG: hypothetical protein B6245_08360 [Desulfobacteraceae bacterium 4572_88]|nr:MAG: hypothetical protein B6245_08360 [Desulfobacteraceae bacterium 4572_88]